MHSNITQELLKESHSTFTQEQDSARQMRPTLMARRLRCSADGVGLSHYILMDRHDGKDSTK